MCIIITRAGRQEHGSRFARIWINAQDKKFGSEGSKVDRALAQGFDKINTTITNVNTILTTISIAVVTCAIIWAGFKMIFQGARLADVANVLIGGTLVGGAAASTTNVP